MSKDVQIVGLSKLEAALVRKVEVINRAASLAIAEEAQEAKTDAVHLAPDGPTGDLDKGIRSKAEGLEGEVRSTTRYGKYVEHGTYKDKAQPFMEPTAEKARRRLPKRITALIRTAAEAK